MKKILLIVSLLLAANTFASEGVEIATDGSSENAEVIYSKVMKKATFPGVTNALAQFLSENIKYPEEALEAGIQGKVWVEFIVEKDGSITNVTVKRSVYPPLDEEAIRVVKMMPKWQPAEEGGEAVRSRFLLPISFKLM